MPAEILQDQDVWDQFVDRSPGGLLFHKWNFLKIIEKHSGYSLFTFGIHIDGKLEGIFPLFYKKTGWLKQVFSPPPGTGVPYLGVILSAEYEGMTQHRKEMLLTAVIDEANEAISRLKPNYVSISTVPGFLDVRPFLWHGYDSKPSYTYMLDLLPDEDEILKSFSTFIRRQLKKQGDATLEAGQAEDISELMMFLGGRFKEQGLNLPLVSASYLKELIDSYPAELCCYTLYERKEGTRVPLSSILLHKYKRLIFWLGGTRVSNNRSASPFFWWELMKIAKREHLPVAEIAGANIKRLCVHKNMYNPSLEMSFVINKKDALGKLAESVYITFKKKKRF